MFRSALIRRGPRRSVAAGSVLLAAMHVAAAPALAAVEYTVQDLGPTGATNQPWSLSANGLVAGYSSVGSHDEGFFADGQDYVFIGTPSGTSRSDLLGVNTFGHAVGKSGTVYESGEAILWMDDHTPDGFTRSLGTLGGSRSAGRSINDVDQVVGWSKLAGDAESRPFLWENDVMTPLPLLGGTQGSAEWINNAGQIVGSSTTDTDGLQQFAVLWDGGDPFRLPPVFPGLNNIANFIHDNGDIAGTYRRPRPGGGSITRAAIWRGRELFRTFGTLADGSPAEEFASSWASAVNADGVVVGMSVNAASALVPFVHRRGEMVQLSDLVAGGWVFDFVGSGALNDAGQIVVSGLLPGETGTRALLLTPVAPVAAPVVPASASLAAAPNPFRHGTVLRLGRPAARPTAVDVVDVAGRRVRTLPVPASGRVAWDGTDANGAPVPAGVYFAHRRDTDQALRVVRLR